MSIVEQIRAQICENVSSITLDTYAPVKYYPYARWVGTDSFYDEWQRAWTVDIVLTVDFYHQEVRINVRGKGRGAQLYRTTGIKDDAEDLLTNLVFVD